MNVPSLKGLRVFVVEDEGMVTMMIEDILEDLGCSVVDTAATLHEALAKANTAECDAAILDLNLNGDHTRPVAAALSKRGVPYLFSTGYGKSVWDEFSHVGVLAKPFQSR